MTSDSARVRELTVEAVDAAAEMVARPSVAQRWHEPSALDGMTTGALAAHTLRAAGSVIAYLDRTDPDTHPEGGLLTPVSYFRAAIESPIHERIKEVSADESAIGPEATADGFRDLVSALRTRLAEEPHDRVVAALGGRLMLLDDFCRTRLIEVLTHLDDLAASVHEERPPTSPESVRVVVDILVGIACDRNGDWNVLRALSRRERLGDRSVFPVF